MLCTTTVQSHAESLPPLTPAEVTAVIRDIKAMIKTDESGMDHFVVREATPERIERLFNMPDFLQQPKAIRENGLIFAGQGSLLTFDKPSDVISKVSAWFPSEVAAARASKNQSFFTYLHLYGPFANWNAESAAFLGLWNCMPQIAWLKPHVNSFRKRQEDGGLSLLSIAARSSSIEEFDFGFCMRNRNGRQSRGSPDDARAEEVRRTADKVAPLLSDKFARFLSTNRCKGTGPDDCVLILHLWASLSPADAKLARAIQMLESEIAPDGPLPALPTATSRDAPPSEGEYLRLDSALRRAVFLRAKLLSVLKGGKAWAAQTLPATLHQMTELQRNMGAATDYRFKNYELEYHNEPINPWNIVSSNFGKSAQLREAVWGEINGFGADIPCEFFDLWFKSGGPSMQTDYVLQHWLQGQPARCAAPDWAWLKKGESAEARDLRTRYLALLGHGDLDETLLGNFTNNGEDCFGSDGPPGQDWLRNICEIWISEPQIVSRQLAHSHLTLSDAKQFRITPMQPSPVLAEGDVTEEQSKWLMGLLPGMSAESGKQMQVFADDLHNRNVHIMSAKLWAHPKHASALLELELSANENSRVLLVVEPKGVVTVEVPQRFQGDNGYLKEIAYVSDLDDDGHLELWWAEGRRCHDMSDLERNLDCSPKIAAMGEIQGRVLSYFSTSSGAKQKPVKPAPQAAEAKAVEPLRSVDQTCAALADSLALDFGGGELNGGRDDVIGMVCKPRPLHPEGPKNGTAPYATIHWPDSLNPRFVNLGEDHFLLATSSGMQLWDAKANTFSEVRDWSAYSDLDIRWARLGTGTLITASAEDDKQLPLDSLLWWNAKTRRLSAPLPVEQEMLVRNLIAIDTDHALVCMWHRFQYPLFTDNRPVKAFVLSLRDGILVRETGDSDRLRSALLAAGVRGSVEGVGNLKDASPSTLPPVFFNADSCVWEMKVLPDFLRDADAKNLNIKHYRLPDGRILVGHADKELLAPLLWNEKSERWDAIDNTAQEGTFGQKFQSYGIDDPVVSVSGVDPEFVEFLDPNTMRWVRSRQTFAMGTYSPRLAPLSTGQALVFLSDGGNVFLFDPMRESVPEHFAYGHTRWGEVKLKRGGIFLAGGGSQWHPNNRPEMLVAPAMLSKPIAPLPSQLGYLSGVELPDETVMVFGGLPPKCGPWTDGNKCGKQQAQPSYRYFPKEDRWELITGLAVHFAHGQFWDTGNSVIAGQWPRNDALIRRNGDFFYLDSGNFFEQKGDSKPVITTLNRWRLNLSASQSLAALRHGRTHATLLELRDGRLVVIGGRVRQSANEKNTCPACPENIDASPPEFAHTTEIFDEKANRWVTGPVPNYGGGRAVKLANGRIFKLSMKGWGAETGYRAEVTNAAFKAWIKLPPFPMKEFNVMDMVVTGNRVLILPEKPYRKVVIWNDTTRTWSLSEKQWPDQAMAFTPLDAGRALVRYYSSSFKIVPIPN